MNETSEHGSSLSSGLAIVAGVVVAVVGLLGIVALIGVFFFVRASSVQRSRAVAERRVAELEQHRAMQRQMDALGETLKAKTNEDPESEPMPQLVDPPGTPQPADQSGASEPAEQPSAPQAAEQPGSAQPGATQPTDAAGARKPLTYVAYRASAPPKIDGRLDDAAWTEAPWSADFVDIEGASKPLPRFRTRMKMSWDDKFFYVGAQMDEPHVWGTLTEHDSVIFHDNDFEVFIDPDGDTLAYGEFEINALNTGWDLFLPKPYRHGGKADNGWEIPGLKTAIHVDGTLNDPSDEDRGWSVELAFPWEVLGKLSPLPAPPADGDQWRINFSRVEWKHQIVDGKYQKVPDTKEDNWVWSPQGVIDMHRPETWGFVRFLNRVNHRGTEGTEKD